MPALKPTDYVANVTWLGRVVDGGGTLRSEPLEKANLSFDGIAGEAHSGSTRPSCSRVTSQHPRGTTIANVRQLSVLSVEELNAIAAEMKLDAIDPTWIGASLVLRGIPDFTRIPPSSRLQAPSGATLIIDMENRPCHFPGREIEQEAPGFGGRFKAAAKGMRGVTAWVEREGAIAIGDPLVLHIPDQPVWAHLEKARA